MSDFLTSEEILQAKDLKPEVVDIPEWGGKVLVRGMTGAERARFDDGISTAKTRMEVGGKKAGAAKPQFDLELHTHRMKVMVCAYCMVDQDSKRIFSDAQVEKLGAKCDAALQRVYDVAIRLSGLTDEGADEIEGESEGEDGEDSSDSPSDTDA